MSLSVKSELFRYISLFCLVGNDCVSDKSSSVNTDLKKSFRIKVISLSSLVFCPSVVGKGPVVEAITFIS